MSENGYSRRTVLQSVGAVSLVAAGSDGGPVSDTLRAQTTTAVSTDWNTFHGDSRNSGHKPAATGPRSNPSVVWQHPTNHRIDYQPCLSGDSVFFPRSDGEGRSSIVSVSPFSGETVKTFADSSDYGTQGSSTTGLLADSGTLYITGLNGVNAVDISSGQRRWRQEGLTDDGDLFPQWYPCLGDTHLFVASNQGLGALDPATGAVDWARVDLGEAIDGGPAVSGDSVFLPTGGGKRLYALDADSGATQWTLETDAKLRCTPTVVDDTVYAAASQETLYAVDADSGAITWTYDDVNLVDNSVAATDQLVVHSDGQQTVALDSGSGDVIWRNDQISGGEASPVIAGETVYVPDGQAIGALRLETGEELWSLELNVEYGLRSTPVVSDGTLFVGASGSVFAIQDGAATSDPTADISAQPQSITQAGDAVTFSGEQSSDPDGTITSYVWKISNSYYTGREVTHTFEHTTEGNRQADLLVIDDAGAVDIARMDIPLSERTETPTSTQTPTATPSVPPSPTATVGGTASDPAAGWLTDLSPLAFGGGLVGALGVAGVLLWRRSEPAEDDSPDTTALLDEADQALSAARTARSSGEYARAIELFETAISRYAAAESDPTLDDDQQATVERHLPTARESLEAVEQRQAAIETLTETLSEAESALQTALTAHAEGQQTLARSRYRQARSRYERALETLADADEDLLADGLAISWDTASDSPPATVDAVPALGAGETPAAAGIESQDDYENATDADLDALGPVYRPLATAWWESAVSTTFTDRSEIQARQAIADRGLETL